MFLVALLWQSLPLARLGTAQSGALDFAHAALHWLGATHHHHADGDFHFDASSDSVQHLIADQSNPTAVRADDGHGAPTRAAVRAPLPLPACGVAPPFLEGPLRPPRALA